MLTKVPSQPDLDQLLAEATQAAGRTESLRTRANSYLAIYKASNGACVFALIAAHGAIWASWYLVCAKLAAMVFAVFDFTSPYRPRYRYRQFSAYVLALKTINREVMIATFQIVHCIQRHGVDATVAAGFPADLVNGYAAAMNGRSLTDLRALYNAHFLWEQDRVVSDTLTDAFATFDWPFMAGLCQRPWVWFSYFRVGKSMNFREFTDKDERVEKGLLAFDRASLGSFDRLADQTMRGIRLFEAILGKPKP